MKKSELIKEIATKTGTERAQVETVVETFMILVMQHVTNKEYVALRGFGSFGLKKRAAKIGRIISKNTPIKIPAHFIPAFKPSKKFIRKLKTIVVEG
jgi:DNA-binding protein HU-beta